MRGPRLVVALGGLAALGVLLGGPTAAAQDTTSLLSAFLVQLRNGTIPTTGANTFLRTQTFRAAHSDASSVLFSGLNSGADVANNSIMWTATDLSAPYSLGTYMTGTGAFLTGKYVVISNKRFSVAGLIMGVSATSDGNEPTMLAISPDVNGPALGIEATGTPTGGTNNQSAIGFYDIDTAIGGSTAYSSGYHAKKAQITGNGSFFWGANLSTDPPTNYEAKLVPTFVSATQKGLALTANAASAVVDLFETTTTSTLRNWRIATNSVANGSWDLLVGASQGASPSVTAVTVDASGNLSATGSVRTPAVAFASVPGTPVEGMRVPVTDSTTATWGATITGGGANHVLAYYNGTTWTVAGK